MQDDDEYTRVGRRYVEGAYDGVCKSMGMMTTKEARDIILNDPDGNIIKRMEAIAVARHFLGEDCTMEEIWKWAEGGGNNEEKAVK